MRPCAIHGCANPARERKRLCHKHLRRKDRGQPMTGPASISPREALRRAALAYAEAEGDVEYRRADEELWRAAAAVAERSEAARALAMARWNNERRIS